MKNLSLLLSLIATTLTNKVLAGCFSERLGFPCCPPGTKVEYSDEEGDWGIINEEWCGISDRGCWAEEFGYPCCSNLNNKIVYYIDEYGNKWGVENDDWCGLM